MSIHNQHPAWLDLAHKLDEAIFAAYGWKSDLSDEEILGKLLSLHLERGSRWWQRSTWCGRVVGFGSLKL
jgi:hypothetical protein